MDGRKRKMSKFARRKKSTLAKLVARGRQLGSDHLSADEPSAHVLRNIARPRYPLQTSLAVTLDNFKHEDSDGTDTVENSYQSTSTDKMLYPTSYSEDSHFTHGTGSGKLTKQASSLYASEPVSVPSETFLVDPKENELQDPSYSDSDAMLSRSSMLSIKKTDKREMTNHLNLGELRLHSSQSLQSSIETKPHDELEDSITSLRQGVAKLLSSGSIAQTSVNTLLTPNGLCGVPHDAISQRSVSSSAMMPLITTRDVRNRSFLVGSSGRAQLMGIEELERYFPDHKLTVFCGTWNMFDMKLVPESLDEWLLPECLDYVHDMYVIGTQESCPNRKAWEILVQETLGPSHVLLHTAIYGVLYLNVFLRRDLIWFCSVTEEAYVSTRIGPPTINTKGAIAICFTFFGTSFLLINAHLAAHDGKVKERIADYEKVISTLNLPSSTTNASKVSVPGVEYSSPGTLNNLPVCGFVVASLDNLTVSDDVTARFDSVFWMGDLNFRLLKERERISTVVSGMSTLEVPNYDDLMRHDELTIIRNEGLAFEDFQEGRIKFKPTYKYDPGTNNYDTSKKLRIPSYTDRILFRSKKKENISCLFYDSVSSLMQSDHKPVHAVFEVLIRPGKDRKPAENFTKECDWKACVEQRVFATMTTA